MATDHIPLHQPPQAGLNALHDYIVLALDQLETGPNDRAGFTHLVACLIPATRIAKARLAATRP